MIKSRKISNLIAEELQNVGLDENSKAFESKVNAIVKMISEEVEKASEKEDEEVEPEEEAKPADKKDAGAVDEDFDEDDYDEDDDYPVDEDSEFYIFNSDCEIGDIEVSANQFLEIEDTGDGTLILTIYDEDGEVLYTDIDVTADDIADIIANADELDIDDDYDDDVDEAVKKFKIKGGKKVKLNKNQIKAAKLKARGKAKKGYKFVDGKQVKMTPAEKKARKMIGKKLAKKGKAARKRSMKKAAALSDGASAVKEGFYLSLENGARISIEEGDEIVVEDGKITVIREGNTIISGIEVSESFINRCISEGVVEGKDCDECGTKEEAKPADKKDAGEIDEEDEDEDEVEESSILTFQSGKGYVLVKEGSEVAMGNRIRARGYLTKQGYAITSEMLDKAADGGVVTL